MNSIILRSVPAVVRGNVHTSTCIQHVYACRVFCPLWPVQEQEFCNAAVRGLGWAAEVHKRHAGLFFASRYGLCGGGNSHIARNQGGLVIATFPNRIIIKLMPCPPLGRCVSKRAVACRAELESSSNAADQS